MNLKDKAEIYTQLIQQLDFAINEAKLTLQNTIEARNNESKSTAGDKYETGRAMMQIEQQQNEIQLNKLNTLKAQLRLIKINKEHKKASLGSLIQTNNGAFFLAIPFGKISYKNTDYHVISLASPLGKQLLDKKPNDTFTFLEKEYLIKIIV